MNINKSIPKTIVFIFLLLFSGLVNAQIVNIPDANFKTKLISLGVDSNSDGDIQQTEALSPDSLDLMGSSISDLTGIENFANLTYLSCGNNQITMLDVSNLVNLEYLYCDNNPVTSLNITGLVNLTELSCENCLLTSLDVSANTNLNYLSIVHNQLTDIDLAGLTHLHELHCYENLFTNLNVNFLTNLRILNYGNVGLNPVDLSNLNLNTLYLNEIAELPINLNSTNITSLGVLFTFITQLDLSNYINLSSLDVNSNALLTYINLKNGRSFLSGGVANNANLLFVCANENDIDLLNLDLLQFNNGLAQVSPYCTFTPGGNFNTIKGSAIFDSNNNGCGTLDPLKANISISTSDGTNESVYFTTKTGNYSFYTEAGSFDVSPNIENPTWFNFSPITATIPFADDSNHVVTQNFCLTTNGIHNDLEIVISPITQAIPGVDAVYNIVWKNKGTQPLTGNVNFIYDDSVLDYVSSTIAPGSQIAGSITWSYANLLPFETGNINVTLHVNSPSDIPAININDHLYYTVSSFPTVTDENPNDNTFQLNHKVVGSVDPNNIICLEGFSIASSTIGDYIHYAINFENTGTSTAENVVVKMVIDTAKFDINSLQILYTSDTAETKVTGNVVECVLKNMMLPKGGHGHILLKMPSNASLISGDTLLNKAEIFFDYCTPITTKLDTAIFSKILSIGDHAIDNFVNIYPAPARDFVTVKSKAVIKTLQLFDIEGRIIITRLVEDTQSKFDISSCSNGIYFLKITTAKGIKIEKLIKN